MNWNGVYLKETLSRHDEVNSSIDVLLNFGGFMYIGAIIPWSDFNSPEVTGITPSRLIALGVLILLFRRIPAIMVMYKAMPHTVKSWREALFMGYFGPIGIGAVFYVEHARHLFPSLEDVETREEMDLLRAMRPVVYFLVLFSIVVHGLSIPLLELMYRVSGVQPIVESTPSLQRSRSASEALPPNSHLGRGGSVVRHNRFSRVIDHDDECGNLEEGWAMSMRDVPMSRAASRVTSRGRQMSDTLPIFRSGADKDDVLDAAVERERDAGRTIKFVDERELRSPRPRSEVDGFTTSFAHREGVDRKS